MMTRIEKSVVIRAMREGVFFAQAGKCWTCGETMVNTEDRGNPRRMELAHIIPDRVWTMRLWGERVINHRKNVHGTHPGSCNDAVQINPDSLEAERLAYDIQRAIKLQSDRRYRGRAMGRAK